MGSSRSTRNAQRATAGGEIVAVSVGSVRPEAAIPIKLAQALGSFGMFCRTRDNSNRDRALQFFQGVLATIQLTLATYLLFTGQVCESNSKDKMCTAAFWLALVYHGTLLTGWGVSELIRQPGMGSGSSDGTSSTFGSLQSMELGNNNMTAQIQHIPQAPQTPRPNIPARDNKYGVSRPEPLSLDSRDNSVVSERAVVILSPRNSLAGGNSDSLGSPVQQLPSPREAPVFLPQLVLSESVYEFVDANQSKASEEVFCYEV